MPSIPAPPTTRLEAWFGDRVIRCYRDRPPHLAAVLEAAVAQRPDDEALVCGPRRLDWREVRQRAGRLAAGLAARGVAPGSRVALVLGNEIEFVLFCHAVWLLDAAIVPISIREQAPGIGYIVGHCGATVLVADAALAERLPDAGALPSLVHRLLVEPGITPWQDLDPLDPPDPLHPATVSRRGEASLAAILYTSGTTGRPKGAMLTHFNIIQSTLHYRQAFALRDGERCCVTVPLSHVTGLVALFAVALMQAGPLIILPRFRAADFLALAERERIAFTIMVPAMYVLCLLDDSFCHRELSHWRIGGYGGAPMSPATIDRLAGVLPQLQLSNCYGATETTSPATIMPPAFTREHPDSVGLPVACGEVIVVDADGRELPRGEVGELWLKGPMVVPGYWDDPAATAANFTAGHWHSGDLGRVDADGFVQVLDRQKDMVNRGGYKIYSSEVEHVLARHPAVVEAAVVARPCPVLGERVHAFVTLRDTEALARVDADQLRAHCAVELTDYKVPETLTLGTDPLPRNANGKILKRTLREQVGKADTASGPARQPSG